MVYSNTEVFGGYVYGKSGYFPCLKHLLMLLKCNFSGLHILHLIKDTDSM